MAKLVRRSLGVASVMVVLVCGSSCGDDAGGGGESESSGTGGNGGSAAASAGKGGSSGTAAHGGSGGQAGASGSAGSGAAGTTDCSSSATDLDKAVCAAEAFLATLSASELSSVSLAFDDAADRTKWSNLPGTARAGLSMGSLSDGSQAAALALMQTLLSSAGIEDLSGVRAADDYLGSQGSGTGPGMMGGGGGYASTNYYVAVFGIPSATGNWGVTFGGHHMAYNITFLGGVGYPVPNHIGVEPKASFTLDGVSYAPLEDDGNALIAVFKALSATDLSAAYLEGQTFADVLIGPVEYGTGSAAAAKAKFPSGSNRTGVLVSSLTAEQQALVTTAIKAWVGDYNDSIADALLTAYTSSSAYADTYVAWAGTESAGVDPDVNGTYMRIDGPRVWIEIACQGGVVIQGKTHYHTIYRDKQYDYAGTL